MADPLQTNKDGGRDRVNRNVLIGLAVAVIVLVALGLAFFRWYAVTDLSITQRREFAQGLASVGQALAVLITGAAALSGLYFTWQNLNQARESTEKQLRQARE